MAVTRAQALTTAAGLSQAAGQTLAAAAVDMYLALVTAGETEIARLGAAKFVAAVKTAIGDNISA